MSPQSYVPFKAASWRWLSLYLSELLEGPSPILCSSCWIVLQNPRIFPLRKITTLVIIFMYVKDHALFHCISTAAVGLILVTSPQR